MKLKNNFIKYLLIVFCVLAVGIVGYVLFQYPQPGVADQGDFDRVMFVSGLELPAENKNDPKFDRFYNYIVTDYKITDFSIRKVVIMLASTSMAYLINLVSLICKIFGQSIFKTGYLSVAYALLYIFSMYVIFKYLNIKNKVTFALLTLISLFVFFDGNYLVWFNSLYGEPMMITTLMLYISAWLYYIYNKNVLKNENKIFSSIIFIFIAAFLFLGSKMQVVTGLPFIAFMLIKVIIDNKPVLSRSQLRRLYIFLIIVIIYPVQIHVINGMFSNISKDTQYNSVFYGVLKDSKNPRQDLIDMGLNPDMAVEAGKHSYLDEKEYVKYVPRTELTEKEFYSKMSNGKLVKFYVTHPARLIQGMEYTASHAFFTGTSLGKYQRSYSEEPVREFNRFTNWSSFREKMLPKRFIFIVLAYIAVLIASVLSFIKNKDNREIKDKILLLWSVMLVGLIQYPMPFMGNGQADTTKQLYLFNFIFDIILVVSVCWCFDRLVKLINFKNNK